jgi:alpha-D-ribose 1-methylphosphonate 5-triphosphate diphosphatase
MTAFANARIVLEDRIHHGALTLQGGSIAAITEGTDGLDCEADLLIPGLIDLHTDNLERQVLPRPTARWPSRSALHAHDAQCAAAGITTVFDALCLGDIEPEKSRNITFEQGFAELQHLTAAGVLKCAHFLHLRCELPAPEMPEILARVVGSPMVRLISLMDHSPGIGQHHDLPRYRKMREDEGFSAAQTEAMIAEQQAAHLAYHAPQREFVLRLAAEHGIQLASHDDHTEAEVARNHAEGIRIAEFPISLAAARRAKALGQATIAGAPNIVRGGSHSGNVAVLELVRAGLLDALASDYVPAAMLEAAFITAARGLLPLPGAIALVTAGPAAIAGLADRGRIAPGLRADLLRVRIFEDMPVIRAVYREGLRIA